MICLPDDGDTLGRDLPDDSDRYPRTWEWVTHDQVFRDIQLSTKFPDFVFELHTDKLALTLILSTILIKLGTELLDSRALLGAQST